MKHYSAGKLLSNDVVEVVEMMRDSDFGTWFTPPRKKQIAWVEETESTLELWYKTTRLQTYGTFNDFYGYNTSKKAAIGDANRLIKSLDIDPASGLFVQVVQKIEQIPMLLTEEPQSGKKLIGNLVNRERNDMFLNDQKNLDLLKMVLESGADHMYERSMEIKDKIQIKTKVIAEDKVVWNSLKGDIE